MRQPPRPHDAMQRIAGRPRPLNLTGSFTPAPDLAKWMRDTFIEESGALSNPDHAHLAGATFGCLWTVVDNTRQQRTVLATAELGEPRGSMGKWPKARALQQVEEWFGEVPDFIITVSVGYAESCTDAEFCALVEHELYHCHMELDEFGAPKFSRETGAPKFAMRGHDVEEFTGIVERYGLEVSAARVLGEAIRRGPTIARADIAGACGVCLRLVA